MTAAFCFVRGLPVLAEGWRHASASVTSGRGVKISAREAA
jgi:hypothetical protein